MLERGATACSKVNKRFTAVKVSRAVSVKKSRQQVRCADDDDVKWFCLFSLALELHPEAKVNRCEPNRLPATTAGGAVLNTKLSGLVCAMRSSIARAFFLDDTNYAEAPASR